MGEEKKSKYYQFSKRTYNAHYSESPYFPVWEAIMDLIPEKDLSIIDLGCGPGQLAHMLHDNGFKNYLGVDFSTQAIKKSKSKNLDGYEFILADLFSRQRIRKFGKYDIVIICEVLEHLNHDLELLSKIDEKKRVIFSVPNFDSDGHVRHFHSKKDVHRRYSTSIKFSAFDKVNNIYIVSGRKDSQKIIYGNNLELEPGVVLGNQSIDRKGDIKIPQRGYIVIGDNVYIGANTTIALGRDNHHPTIIGNDVIIGPNCVIGHGVKIGKKSMVHGGSVIGGFCTLGENSRIGLNATLRNRVVIGKNSMAGLGAVVTRDVDENVVVVGNPARKMRENKRDEPPPEEREIPPEIQKLLDEEVGKNDSKKE